MRILRMRFRIRIPNSGFCLVYVGAYRKTTWHKVWRIAMLPAQGGHIRLLLLLLLMLGPGRHRRTAGRHIRRRRRLLLLLVHQPVYLLLPLGQPLLQPFMLGAHVAEQAAQARQLLRLLLPPLRHLQALSQIGQFLQLPGAIMLQLLFRLVEQGQLISEAGRL